MTTFGQVLKRSRVKARITLREFCRQAKMDAGNQSRYERSILPPPQSRMKILEWFSIMGYLESSEEARTALLAAAMELSSKVWRELDPFRFDR